MKKSFLIFVFSFFSFFIYAQNGTYNTQKGYIAEGYDVVSYFSNKAIKGKKNSKQHIITLHSFFLLKKIEVSF